jgi:hypothetical protein
MFVREQFFKYFNNKTQEKKTRCAAHYPHNNYCNPKGKIIHVFTTCILTSSITTGHSPKLYTVILARYHEKRVKTILYFMVIHNISILKDKTLDQYFYGFYYQNEIFNGI